MSKVAAYLQEHILGEVSIQPAILAALSTDASILMQTPEMAVYPRVTNDIRKVARFAWQLAEKGHILPITARGSGTDQTGAAIGRGVSLVLPAHLNRPLEFDQRQKLVRLQPGMNAQALSDMLQLQGMTLPVLPRSYMYSTIGGAVANNASGARSGRFGTMRDWTHQLEIVLANGDILQTERLSKRDLNKKKGITGFEGDIYRKLDNLIDDNRDLIVDKLSSENSRDAIGYTALREVKHKDGSFDLTPLFVGSQGTLGIISEMILRVDYAPSKRVAVVASFPTAEAARDTADALRSLEPTLLEYYDSALFQEAAKQGRLYPAHSVVDHRATLVIVYEDFSDHVTNKKLKKTMRLLEPTDALVTTSNDEDIDTLLTIRDVTTYMLRPNGKGISAPPLLDGIYIPADRREQFMESIAELAHKHHVELGLYGDLNDNIWYARPHLQLSKVSDKQKIFKLLDECAGLAEQHRGLLIGEAGEGRLKALAVGKTLDKDVRDLFTEVKNIFDPHGILNPGVKQSVELRQLVAQLRPDYDAPRLADQSPTS
jgi:FAD/FMN-containing dehydrogenase